MKFFLWIAALFAVGMMTSSAQLACADPNCSSCLPAEPASHMMEKSTGHDGEDASHDEHEGHDHEAEEAAHDEHEGHDVEAEGGLKIPSEMAGKVGIELKIAAGGLVSTAEVFPAEVMMNRDRAALVSARYPGVIRQVFVSMGDPVKKGDVLVSLENRETLAIYTVLSPLDGMIVKKNISAGEIASADHILFTVADLSSVWVDISISPPYQKQVEKGMPVEFIAADGTVEYGVVHYLSPLMSRKTRTFTARCVLDGATDDFMPGAFVRARMVLDSVQVPVRIERDAVQTVHGETVIFIQDEHGFESRDVVVGRTGERFVEVAQGLAAGERYVAAGAFVLKSEMVTSGMDPHAGPGH